MSQIIPIPVQLNVETSSEQYALSVSEQNIPISFQIGTQIVAGTTASYEGPYSVTPTEEQQTLATAELKMDQDVTVGAIPSDYVGSDVPRHDSSDLVTSGATVSVPAGHYAENASKSIQNATVQSGTNVTVNPTLSVNYDTGEITASVSKTQSVNVVTEAGYAPVTSHNVVMSGSAATQLITHDSSDMTVNGPTVTAPAGYYPDAATKDVEDGVRGNRVNTIGYSGTKKTYKISYPDATSGYYAAAIVKEPGQFELERQQETVTPTESAQEVTPTNSLYYLEKVTVNPIPTDYGKIEQNGSVLTIS